MSDVTDPPSLRDRIAKVIYDHTRDSSAFLPERCDEAAAAIIGLLTCGHIVPGPDAHTCLCGQRVRPDAAPVTWDEAAVEALNAATERRRQHGVLGIPVIADTTVPPHEARIRSHSNPQAACTRTTECASGTWSGDHLAGCPVGDNAAAVERALLPHAACPDMAHPHTPHAYVQPPESRAGGHTGYRRAWCNGTQGTLHPPGQASDPTPAQATPAQPEAAATPVRGEGGGGHLSPKLRFTAGADARAGQTLTFDDSTGMLIPEPSYRVTTYPRGLGKGALSAPMRAWWCITCGQLRQAEGTPRPEDRCPVCGTTSCHTGGDAVLRSASKRRVWNADHPDNPATALAPGGPGTVDLTDTTTTTEDA